MTIARDYAVGVRLTESQRVARRKRVEIHSPTPSPQLGRENDADADCEAQNLRNANANDPPECGQTDGEQHDDLKSESFTCGRPLLAALAPSKSVFRTEASCPRPRDRDAERMSSSDYVTAISVHLRAHEPHVAALGRPEAMKSFNKCPLGSASYV